MGPAGLGGGALRSFKTAEIVVHRLRRYRSIQSALWRAAHASRAGAIGRGTRLRRISGQSQQHRLPHGPQPAPAGEGVDLATRRGHDQWMTTNTSIGGIARAFTSVAPACDEWSLRL